jgi:hypothetical protein
MRPIGLIVLLASNGASGLRVESFDAKSRGLCIWQNFAAEHRLVVEATD